MTDYRKYDLKANVAKLTKYYADSDLFSLLLGYTDKAERAIGGRIRYPAFFEAVGRAVVPVGLTDVDAIAEAMGENWSYRELSLLYDYATAWAVKELTLPIRSDKALCDTVEYLKALHFLESEALFFRLSEAERILSDNEHFAGCDEVTRNLCRERVSAYAKRFSLSEAEAARILTAGELLGYEKGLASRLYFPVLGLLFLLFAAGALWLCRHPAIWLFLLLPLSEAAKQVGDLLFSFLVKVRPIPRKKLTEIPSTAATLTVITALLTGREDDLKLVEKLRNCYFANRDPHAHFGLLCDLREADTAETAGDAAAIQQMQKAMDALNQAYGCSLRLFVRRRRFAPTEGRYMGWERKRGAVIELTRFLRGKETTITAYCGGDLPAAIRYVITLDSDTRLYHGAVRDMVGAMLHPANRPMVENGMVVKGHAILQPRMEASLASAEKTPFAVLSAGNGGTDIYASAAYETYQTLFDEGIFCGKGIFDVDAFATLIDGRFPDGAVLSHDLLEGSRLRAGALTDLPLTDDLPGSPLTCLDRSHRWIRGDVQALAFTGKYVRDEQGALYRNPISRLSQIKIYDNVRRALVPISAALSILLCLFAPDAIAAPSLHMALAYLLLPCLFSVIRLIRFSGRRFFSFVLPGMLHALGNLLYAIASLLQTAVMSGDAVLRAGYRMLFSRKNLLEWKTASEAEQGMKGLPLYLYRMLPSVLFGLALMIFSPDLLFRGLGLLWVIFPFAAYRIGKPFSPAPKIPKADKAEITAYAKDQWQFFADHVTEADSHLPPDNLQLSPTEVVAHRTSPTNIGLYLLSCVAAEAFGFITKNELMGRLKKTMATIERLQKWHGHLYNWYDTEDLSVLGTPYVSTVDSGNFVTCLVALSQALARLDDGTRRFTELRAQVDALIDGADFSLLYNGQKKLFRIGIRTADDSQGEGCYDLFMSEARTTSYFAIATGQVPREHWNRLSRVLIGRDGYLGLASWTGTMFEYLMPSLLLPTRFGSLSYEALSFAVREQRIAATHGVWGRSECGYFRFDADMNYQYKAVGAPALGLKRGLHKDNVIAPYASFLCLRICPAEVLDNLERLKKLDLYGPYGFYEAIDFTAARVGNGRAIIRSYMSHHMGMSLLSCANACFNGMLVSDFMADPRMASSAELLEEKIPVHAPLSPQNTRLREPRSLPPTRGQLSRLLREEAAPPAHPYASIIAENGLSAVAKDDLLKLSAMGVELAVDPFVFGRAHRPRFLFSADGVKYDLLAGSRSRGVTGNRLVWRLDTPKLMAELSLSILGRSRSFVMTLEAEGYFHTICPLLVFEPSLTATKDREAHPAYADLHVTATYRSDESAILYTRRQKDGRKPDLCLAVSLESYGGHEIFETRRDVLGLLYDDTDVEALLDRPFSCESGTLIHPFCAIKKESKAKGRYVGNLLLSVGKGETEALASLKAARAELAHSRRQHAAKYAASRLTRTVAEKVAGCGHRPALAKTAELILTCLYQPPRPCAAGRTFAIGDLWKHGISGDLPIVCLILDNPVKDGSPALRHLTDFIAAHKYLALSGIRLDLVILYESGGAYHNPPLAAITEAVEACAGGYLLGHAGGIYPLDGMAERELFETVVCLTAVLDADFTLDALLNKAILPVTPAPAIITQPEGTFAALSVEEGIAVHGGVFARRGFAIDKGKETSPLSYVYAMGHFGTLVTQNSLGYTWIGNCHERRITPFRGDDLLDFAGERLLYRTENGIYDLCAAAHRVFFGFGRAEWLGTVGGKPYTVTATIDPYLPCKVITVTLPEESKPEALTYEITPVMGERPARSRPVETVTEGDTIRYIPRVTAPGGYDVGFLVRRDFGGTIGFLLGAYPAGGEATLDHIRRAYHSEEAFSACGAAYESRLASYLPSLTVKLPDAHLAVMVNDYLPRQALVCRLFGRTGFFQSGGAYGFRDQLQDCLAILRFSPQTAKVHILRAASHQYEEGDVMHWWHMLRGVSRGVRSRYTDDRLWLPYTVAEYLSVTEDRDILDIRLPYLTSCPLSDREHDRYEKAERSPYREPLYSHCVRAIEVSLAFGQHGLPLMGGGDWNDGMNKVGEHGGESVWLGMFLLMVLEAFAPIAASQGDLTGAVKYRRTAGELREACERAFADGQFLRAYYGDGTPLGGDEAIDILPQAFAALAGLSREKAASGLAKAWKRLFDREHGIYKLLTPPYDRSGDHDPGYIASYPAGIRENGGQYTHAAVWGAMGLAAIGRYEEAAVLLRTINPASLCETPEGSRRYSGEPYYLAGDVSASPDFPGRCGWSLYTGAAGWFYLAVTESLMGFRFAGDSFTVTPRLSEAFPCFAATFTREGTSYTVLATIGDTTTYRLDGKNVNNLFYFDKNTHLLEITVEISSDLR